MLRSRTPSQGGGSQRFEMERKYSVPSNPDSRAFSGTTSEDLHAWSIYRQNLNSDFTDSALGSTDKSPLPYGNFQLRDTTVQSILSHPRYGPKSALGANMFTYLKFGLPRVFPPNHNGSHRSGTPQQQQPHFMRNSSTRPQRHQRRKTKHRIKSGNRGPRDGSSGYDSSDNETTNHYKHSRKYRSDPDFRMHNVHPSYQRSSPGLPNDNPHHKRQRHMNQSNNWNRNKSNSEANLLTTDYKKVPLNPNHLNDLRRNSVAEFGPHYHFNHIDMIDSPSNYNKTESHLSVPVNRALPAEVLRNEYISNSLEDPIFVYPNLHAIGIGVWPTVSCCRPKRHLLVSDISFDIHGGEMMAIMATNEEEGTALLDLIAGRTAPIMGDIILNGQHVRSGALAKRVAYVQNDPHLAEDMTVTQTLRFHHDLKKPTEKLGYLKINAMDRINVLIEDLGLEQVRDTKVSSMTISERRRLNVACHLLLDTDVLVLDQPTRGMDIFDTFFLVEYLRQWAVGGGAGGALGRIVILTLHPPTYEIFTMLSKILLISAGRTMFSGYRRDMLPYFSIVEYPCPAFKNPSDYYLDLVTLDDLSAEAMLESSQRIEQLAELFRQKQPPMNEIGPPAALPMTFRKTNWFMQGIVLFTKSMIYTQPNTFITWLTLIVISASLSLIIGAIFWDIPNSDSQLNMNDRLGYHYSVMCLMSWPLLLLLTIVEMRRNRKNVERDIKDGLYGRFTYITTKTIVNLLPSLFVWLIYLVPSYSMSGLYMQSLNDYDGFYIYIGVMLLYLICGQEFLISIIYILPGEYFSTVIASILIAVLCWPSGYLIHFKDLPRYMKFIQFISPTTWLLPFLLNRDLSPESIMATHSLTICRNKQVQRQDIIVQSACPPPNGTQVLFNFGYLQNQRAFYTYNNVPVALIVFYLISIVIVCFAFTLVCCCRDNRHTNRRRFSSNDSSRT